MVPIHPGDFLGGGEGVGVLAHVAEQVEDLFDIVVSEEVVSWWHYINYLYGVNLEILCSNHMWPGRYSLLLFMCLVEWFDLALTDEERDFSRDRTRLLSIFAYFLTLSIYLLN